MSTRQQQLLVLGAGRGQTGLIRAARHLNCRVVVATQVDRPFPGLALADQILEVDVADPQAVLAATSDMELDGVATACFDTAMPALGAVVDARHLTGPSGEAAGRCLDKLAMKTALSNHGVPTPAFSTVRDLDDLHDAQSLGFPLVLKALDLQGSRGVYVVADLAEAESSFSRIQQQSRRGIAIAESFVQGQEFGAQAFVYQGELVFVMPHGDTVLQGSSIIPIGHHVPWRSDIVSESAVRAVVQDAVQAIGLDNCAVNIDLMESDGRIHVLELTGRVGANALPELVSAAHGIDYYSMIAVTALGGDPRPLWAARSPRPTAAASAMILPPAQHGQIRSIGADTSLLDQGASAFDEIVFFGQVGDRVRGFTSSADCLGQVVVSASTLAQAQDLLEQVLGSIIVQIEDGL